MGSPVMFQAWVPKVDVTPRVILVTDAAFSDDAIARCVGRVGAALGLGGLLVQLRDKGRPRVSLRMFAMQLRKVTASVGAWLVVNGDAAVARDSGADGVHLGGGAGTVAAARATVGRPTWVSVAAHSADDVRRARAEGADAVLVSPVFDSRPVGVNGEAKTGRGMAAIGAAREVAGPMRVYALGGVTTESAPGCVAAGADGVAVIRALLGADDPEVVARALGRAVRR